jgi:hypothetical protein
LKCKNSRFPSFHTNRHFRMLVTFFFLHTVPTQIKYWYTGGFYTPWRFSYRWNTT